MITMVIEMSVVSMMAVMTVMSIMTFMTMMFMMALMNDVCGVRNDCEVCLMRAARNFQPPVIISWIGPI
jgi:hypothetical protein